MQGSARAARRSMGTARHGRCKKIRTVPEQFHFEIALAAA